MLLTVPLVIVCVAVAFMLLGGVVDDRRVRTRRRNEIEHDNVEAALPLLHSINDDRCIGCEACVDVCPTEVLDLVDHKVRVVRFTDCVQCEQCAHVCPTMALVMYREGTTPRMLTVPELDDHFQTGVPGQYLIGEVAGKPLVKNAANLGRAVIEHIATDLGPLPRSRDVLDVVIVGSGPGGLSAGLTCLKRGLTCQLLEKEHVISSTVSRYPKGKHFMAEPSLAINVSHLPVFDASKEDLVAAWQKVVEQTRLPIKLGEAVESVVLGDDGIFSIKTTVATYRCRRVVLATGLRGKPRLLAVPGANLEKVLSLLDDPADFAGEDLLVVGGGDSAVEGAMSLADVGARVTLSYRGDGFKRCKQGNQKRLAEMAESGKVSVLLESNVQEFTADTVTIKLKDGRVETLPNNRAFVLIGADTPVAWLEANNVRFIERPHLYTLGSTEDLVRRLVPDAMECSRNPAEAIAMILGKVPQPQPHRQPRMKSMVGHIRDEFREVVTEVSRVFKLSDLQPPPRDVKRGAHGARATPIASSELVRRKARPGTASDGIPRSEFGPERTVTAATAFGPESTSVRMRPIRPHQHVPKRAAFGGPQKPLRDIFGETGSLPSLGDTGALAKLDFGESRTSVGLPPAPPRPTTPARTTATSRAAPPPARTTATSRAAPPPRAATLPAASAPPSNPDDFNDEATVQVQAQRYPVPPPRRKPLGPAKAVDFGETTDVEIDNALDKVTSE